MICLQWPQLLIKPPSVQLPTQEAHSFPHSVSPAPVFHVYRHQVVCRGIDTQTAHPMRSTDETTAATLRTLVLGAAGLGHHHPGHAPSLPPLPTPSASLCPCSSLAPAQTVVYQHRPEHSAASRNTHGDGAAIPHPAVNTLPRAVGCCQSCAHTHILTPSCQHSCSPLLGIRPSVSHTCSLWVFLMCTHSRGSHLWTRPAHTVPSDLGCQSHHLQLCDLGQWT